MKLADTIRNTMRRFLMIEPAEKRTVTIKEVYSHEGNCAKNRIWYNGKPQQLEEFYREIDIDKTLFWAAPMTKGLEIRKLHTGLPGLVIDIMTWIVANDFNGIEFSEDNEYEEIWKEVAKDNDFDELLETALRETAIVGDGAWKISFDNEITKHAILEFYPAERVEFVYKRGRLREVKFKTEYRYKDRTYWFIETYGYGYFRYSMKNNDGKDVDVETVPETAWAKGNDISFDDSVIWAVPMRYGKSAQFKGRGRSLIDGKDCAGDALDESFSQWMDALRAARPKQYIPQRLVPFDPITLKPQKPNAFDNRFITVGDDMREGTASQIKVESPEIRSDAYLATYITALDLYLQGIMSPSTLGIDVKKLDNAEAQREKEKTTLYTRQNFVEMIQKALPKVVFAVINATLLMRKQNVITENELDEIKAKFGEYANPSFESQVETIGKARTNNVMSIEAGVDEMYGDSKDDDWKETEVERIKQEMGVSSVDEPFEGDDL